MSEIEKYLELRRFVDVLYDIQDVRMRTANRLRQMPKQTSTVYVKPLLDVEKHLTDQIQIRLNTIPIYDEFLDNVKGVGPRISGSIIANTMIRFEKVSKEDYEKERALHEEAMVCVKSKTLMRSSEEARGVMKPNLVVRFSEEQLKLAQKTERGDYLIPVIRGIQAFPTVSKMWAWWGLHVVDGVAPKRKRGENINWNPKMRTLAWKIGKQFVMQGERYRMYYYREKLILMAKRLPIGVCPHYENCKAKLKKRKEPACKGHIDAMSRRKAVKEFVKDLYVRWRTLEGLPVRPPYSHEYLGHPSKKEPEEE